MKKKGLFKKLLISLFIIVFSTCVFSCGNSSEQITKYTLTYSSTEGGSITGLTTQVIEKGKDGSEVEAVPNSGYHFVSWSDNNTSPTRKDTNVLDNATYTAKFEIDPTPEEYSSPKISFETGYETLKFKQNDLVHNLLLGIKVTDEYDSNLKVTVVSEGGFDISKVGTYVIKYSATNSKGKTSYASRNAIVSSSSEGLSIKTNWDVKGISHPYFTDLGNYTILLDTYTKDNFSEDNLKSAVASINNSYSMNEFELGGCTVIAKKNSDNEVIFGRNMDWKISQIPTYIEHLEAGAGGGKYDTLGLSYITNFNYSYNSLCNETNTLSSSQYYRIPLTATDALNEKGFYIEMNVRGECKSLSNTGTNPSVKDALKVNELSIPILVAMNASTCQEAVNLLKSTKYNICSVYPNSSYCMNIAFMIGDATGEYGLVEIAENKVNYIQYQVGQANYYITPEWEVEESLGTGYGRLNKALENINNLNTLEEMRTNMEQVSMEKELYTDYSYRDNDGTIKFIDKDGNPMLDWRDTYHICRVDSEGKYNGTFTAVVDGTTISNIKYDYATKSFKNGDQIIDFKNLTGYTFGSGTLCSSYWVNDNDNFELVQGMLHVLYRNDLVKLEKYYEGLTKTNPEEKYALENTLRNSNSVYFSCLNIGVNCYKKQMQLKLWGDDAVIVNFKYN